MTAEPQSPIPAAPVFLAIPDEWVSNDDLTIRARFIPGKNEYTIKFAIKAPKLRLPPSQIELHSWSMKTPISRLNGNALSISERFFQTSSGQALKNRHTYVHYQQRYHVYSLNSVSPNGEYTYSVSPIFESTAFVHQNGEDWKVNMNSVVSPMMVGNEWTIKTNRKRNKIIVSWRVSTGIGLTMQNQHIHNYYPTVNTGFLLTF